MIAGLVRLCYTVNNIGIIMNRYRVDDLYEPIQLGSNPALSAVGRFVKGFLIGITLSVILIIIF